MQTERGRQGTVRARVLPVSEASGSSAGTGVPGGSMSWLSSLGVGHDDAPSGDEGLAVRPW